MQHYLRHDGPVEPLLVGGVSQAPQYAQRDARWQSGIGSSAVAAVGAATVCACAAAGAKQHCRELEAVPVSGRITKKFVSFRTVYASPRTRPDLRLM